LSTIARKKSQENLQHIVISQCRPPPIVLIIAYTDSCAIWVYDAYTISTFCTLT
jgi:hypothetical protein